MEEQNQNLPATTGQQHPAAQQPDPFAKMRAAGSMNVGSVEIESQRAIAEAQGKLTLAKKFPRSVAAAIQEFMEACSSPEFAATAFYAVPNRGSGPSIRFAEECARCYGNFTYGHRELSRGDGKSEIEVFAWDMQLNNESKRQITVMHVRDKQGGATKLTDQTDIDNRIANVASKQMRGRILALMPKHMVAAGVTRAKATLAGGGGDKPMRERIQGMVSAFAKLGVNVALITTKLGHSVDDTTTDELADLIGIHNAIRDGGKASEYFKAPEVADKGSDTAAALADKAKQGAAATPAAAGTGATPAASPAPAAAKPAATVKATTTKATTTAAPKPAATPAPAPAPVQQAELEQEPDGQADEQEQAGGDPQSDGGNPDGNVF